MKIHLVDGTYELFRGYFGPPAAIGPTGREVGATRGLIRSLLVLLQQPEVTHVAVAFDTVIESFRNDLFAGYKTGAGLPEDLASQFELAEAATRAIGMTVWSMHEFEADDAIAAGAQRYASDDRVEQVIMCSPDKDLAQCVRGNRVVSFDRMRRIVRDEDGVLEKYGVLPCSIPDWLALVGDDADGIPGIPRWGAKSSATVLRRYQHLEAIPDDESRWDVKVRGATALGQNLRTRRDDAMLYKKLATLREDVPLAESVDDLAWVGGDRDPLEEVCVHLGIRDELFDRVGRWRPT